MSESDLNVQKKKTLRKITKQRLKNIGLYYLKRFESSVENLRSVLARRVNDYARAVPEFDKQEAFKWIDEVLSEFQNYNYLNDERFARIRAESYLAAGKPARYIEIKLKQKGISADIIRQVLDQQEYDPKEMALKFARKKKIGPYRSDEQSRAANRQKDLAALVRAGFDYDVASEVLHLEYVDDLFLS